MTIVDFHAHHFPVGLPDLAATTGDHRWPSLNLDTSQLMLGDEVFRPVRAACFDVAARIDELDAAGVDRQVISPVPITLVDWADPSNALDFLRAQNDGLAEAVATSGGRLIALGTVPLQDPNLAIAEMERATRELGIAGLEISALVDGRELDDPLLEPFWAAAEAERVPIFIHPAHQRTAIRRQGQLFEFGLGMLTDTALAAAALVYGGVLERHPDLRIALAHGCGTFGWAHPRFRYIAGGEPASAARLDDLVSSLWVDSLVFDPAMFAVLVDRFGAEHIMYGSDHPFLPDGLTGPLATLENALKLHPQLHHGCLGQNALNFLSIG